MMGMKTKSNKTWFAMFPGDAFATQFYDCNSMKELKQAAREFLGVQRLPRGTQLWSNENK